MATVLMPLPSLDADPTEVAAGWRVLTDLGHRVVFATPDGRPARADDRMVTGRGLDPWGFLPGLDQQVVVGRFLRVDARGRAAYLALLADPGFLHPVSWDRIDLDGVDALYLPGGHRARGMRPYLESETLQAAVVEAFHRELPVAAVCHGVVLAARATDPSTGRSVLWGRRTTALTWSLERRAWRVARVARFWDPGYYRTYTGEPGEPAGYRSVEQEVTRALAAPDDFCDVDPTGPGAGRRRSGRARDNVDDDGPAFVVHDGSLLSARWPGDVHTLARSLAGVLARRGTVTS